MHDIGITNTVATCGTALTHAQAKLLKKHTTKVTLIFDGDAAGLRATDRNAENSYQKSISCIGNFTA